MANRDCEGTFRPLPFCKAVGVALVTIAGLAAADIAATADDLVVREPIEHGRPIKAIYRFDGQLTAPALLEVEWTDVLGRVVERRRFPLKPGGPPEVQVSFDSGRAVTAQNWLAARVLVNDGAGGTKLSHRDRQSRASFVVGPAGDPWLDYQIIMWQRQTPAGYRALKKIGVTAAMVQSDHLDNPGNAVFAQIETMLDSDLRWYLENIATDFYSTYHRWSADRPVNWRFQEAKRHYRLNTRDPEAVFRDPSLSDPVWLSKIGERLYNTVRRLRRYRPLFYNLADEAGIADLSAFWDFDLSPASVAAMREWLKSRYGDLGLLNDEWGSAFTSWDEVIPMTTPEALRRTDQNFSAWADFKEWMDVAFSRALKRGSDAVHAADSGARSAIEGAQIPGWGGYDYSRLAGSVDAMELDAPELLQSLNPNAVMLSTSFGSGPVEEHRVWRALLGGSRGLILWDSKHEFVDEYGNISDRGHEAAPYFQEIRDGLGALLINSRPHFDPVAILYSPESMRIQWLLGRLQSGEDWTRRSASSELKDNGVWTSERTFARALAHMGLHSRLVTANQLDGDELARAGYRLLILPRTIALSARAASTIRRFVTAGGTVLADGDPGLFDEHGRRLKQPALADLFMAAHPGTTSHGRAMLFDAGGLGDHAASERLRAVLATASVKPTVSLSRDDGEAIDDVETFVFNNGQLTIIALLRDIDRRAAASEAKPIIITLHQPREVYDIRSRHALGRMDRLTVPVGSTAPVVLALARQPMPRWSIVGPRTARTGETAEFRLAADSTGNPGTGALHIEVADPDGIVAPNYSGNLLVTGSTVAYSLPLAVNDKIGIWTVRATDLLTGSTSATQLRVDP